MIDDEEEYLKRLLYLFDEKSKLFSRYYTILVLSSLFFMFVLLLPYLLNQIILDGLSNELKMEEYKRDNFTLLAHIHNSLSCLQLKINNNDILSAKNESIACEDSIINVTEKGYQTYKEFVINSTVPFAFRYDCYGNMTNKCIEEQFRNFSGNYNHLVFRPTDNLSNYFNASIMSDFSSFFKPIDNDIIDINQSIYNSDRNIGNTLNFTSEAFFLKLKETLFDDLKNLHGHIDGLSKIEFKAVIDNASEEVERLEKETGELINATNRIENSVTNFQTPIGNVAISFQQIILLYPFIIWGLFIFCLYIRSDLLKLREELSKTSKLSLKELGKLAPLWTDNGFDNARSKAFKFFLVISPLYIYLIWILLVMYSFSLDVDSLDLRVSLGLKDMGMEIKVLLYWSYLVMGFILTIITYYKMNIIERLKNRLE